VALSYVETGLADILLSTSALFTLVLASVFPATNADRFTLSKLVAVTLSIGGVVLVTWSTKDVYRQPVSAVWSAIAALLLALFLVVLRRRVDNEDKLNMSMFYGFVGLCTVVLLWPGLLILHLTKIEELVWPDSFEWSLLVIDGLVSLVFSNFLWLWGCFLTSSLAATLSLSLTIPMTAIAETFLSPVTYDWKFYAGLIPVFIAFFLVTFLSYYDNCDPVLVALKRAFKCSLPSRRRYFWRSRDPDREQTESLIADT
jgi:solute carrier family 35 protein F5